MIEIATVTRDNFDNSGLSNGYAVGTQMSDIETEILRLIKGVFEGIPNKPLKDLDKSSVRTELLSQMATVQNQAVALFRNARDDLFGSLNESIQNGFTVGKSSGASQTGKKPSEAVLTDYERGKETVRIANGSLLKAESMAIMGATARVSSAIALLTSGVLSDSQDTFRECYDRYVVPEFESGLPGKATTDGRQISLVSYAETVVRESSQQALLLGESTAASEAGYPLVMISAHYACCPFCEPWQNAILVDDYFQDGKPDGIHQSLTFAISSGLFHPNCRHVKRIYIPEKTFPNNPPNYDPEKVAVNYELEQMQRKLERDIRNEKRVFTMSLSEDKRVEASKTIRDKQAQLRGLVRYADENGYKVYRQNWKEQIDFEKTPTLPYEIKPEDVDNMPTMRYTESDTAREAKTLIKIQGKSYSKEYRQKLTDAYYDFKEQGVTMGDHALNRFVGQKAGRKKQKFTLDDVVNAYNQPANYVQDDGREIHYYNHVMVVVNPETKQVITVNYYEKEQKKWKKLWKSSSE